MVLSYIKLALGPILWGGALVAGRVVTADLPPVTITWIRFAVVSLILLPVLRLRTGGLPRPTRRDLLFLVALSVVGVVVFNLLLLTGLKTVTAVRSSVIIALAPSVVALLLVSVFRERSTWNTVVGIALAFVGASVTITTGNPARVLAGGISVGDAYLLGCVLSWSLYTILARYAMRRLSSLTVLAYSSTMGAVFLTPVAARGDIASELAGATPATWVALAYLSLAAAGVAYLLYYEGIREVGPNRAAVFLNLEPVSAIVLGVVILGERLSVPLFVGATLVIFGLYMVNRRQGMSMPRLSTPRDA